MVVLCLTATNLGHHNFIVTTITIGRITPNNDFFFFSLERVKSVPFNFPKIRERKWLCKSAFYGLVVSSLFGCSIESMFCLSMNPTNGPAVIWLVEFIIIIAI